MKQYGFIVNTHSIYDVDMSKGVVVKDMEHLLQVLGENEQHVRLYRETKNEEHKKKCAYACFSAAGFSEGYTTDKQTGEKKMCSLYRTDKTTTGLTPLISLDIDKVDGQQEWKRISKIVAEKYGSLEESPLAWSFLSPSKALKMVFRIDGYKSIRQEQLRLYEELQVEKEHQDRSTYNYSRATFLCGPDDTLYINEGKLFGEYEPQEIVRILDTGNPFVHEPLKDLDMLKRMQEDWIKGRGFEDGTVPVGKRHETSLLMYIDFASLFGFRSQLMVDTLRVITETKQEAESIASWACKAVQQSGAGRLSKLMSELKEKYNLNIHGDEICSEPDLPEHLPANMELLLKETPKKYWKQASVALLPMLGTLATSARSIYIDGREQSPTFLVGVIGSQSSNKSFISDLDKVVMKAIRDEDKTARSLQQDYKDKRRSVSDGNKPAKFKGVIRIVSPSRSLQALYTMLANAEGLHVYCISPEIDTMNRSQKGGSWAEMSDFLRNAFDNDEVGNDYANDDCLAIRPNAYYNQLTLGTPDAYVKFFDGNTTNGLTTRFLLPVMQNEFAVGFPTHDHWTDEERKQVDEVIQRMMSYGNGEEKFYELPNVTATVQSFCDSMVEKLSMAGENVETLCINDDYKRCGVMAFRAGLVAYLLNDEVEDKTVTDFTDFIARYSLYCHWDFFGDEEVFRRRNPLTFRSQNGSNKWSRLISRLPHEFTMDDILLERWLSGESTVNLRETLYRLERKGVISRTTEGHWTRA